MAIMRVPAAGGQPVFDGLDSRTSPGSAAADAWAGRALQHRPEPDGSRMSVGARTQASSELWALENVMSVLSGSRNQPTDQGH